MKKSTIADIESRIVEIQKERRIEAARNGLMKFLEPLSQASRRRCLEILQNNVDNLDAVMDAIIEELENEKLETEAKLRNSKR